MLLTQQMLALLATVQLSTAGSSGELEWSNPALIEAPTPNWPLGPDSPAYVYGFDDKHLFSPKSGISVGRGSTWLFSSDRGTTWVTQKTALSAAVNTLIPVNDPAVRGKRSFRNLGAAGAALSPFAYDLINPAELSLLPDGSGLAVGASPTQTGPTGGRNVTFRGIPHPGFNFTKGTPGQYGIARANNGRYVMQANVLWNGLEGHKSYGVVWAPMSVVSFTSADGRQWE